MAFFKHNLTKILDFVGIEGSRQSETKIMKIEGGKLSIKQGELINPKNNGNTVFKDASKAVYKTVLMKTNCK